MPMTLYKLLTGLITYVTQVVAQVGPDVSQGVYEIFFEWIPNTDSCNGSTCAVPKEGIIFYLLVGILVLIAIREGYRRFSGGPDEDIELGVEESEEQVDEEDQELEEDVADVAETESESDSTGFLPFSLGGGDGDKSVSDNDSGGSIGDNQNTTDTEGETPSVDDEEPIDDVDSTIVETDMDAAETEEDSGGLLSKFAFWRSSDDDKEEVSLLRDDPRVDDGKLLLSPEFDDILQDDVKEALIEDEKELEEAFEEADQDLPPALEGEDIDAEEFLSKVERLHQRQIAPEEIEKGDTHYKVGEQYRRVMLAHKIPDVTPLAGLKEIVEDPSLHFDMTVHFHSIDQDKALRSAKNLYRNLSSSVVTQSEDGDELSAGDKAVRMQKVKRFRDEMKRNDERAFNMSLYVSVRDEDEQRLLDKVDKIRDEFRTSANIRLKTVERKQKKAIKSASPLGIDPLYNDDNDIDPAHVGLGRSFGAMVASLTQSRKFEPEGHEWGVHAVQGHPIVKDPFQSSKNYNMTVVGESGTGKSLNTKRMALATKAVHPDTLIIMLDPLQGFLGLAEALDAKKISIGGNQPLNPMEIRKPPDEHIESEAFDEDKDPLSAKVDDVLAFIQNYVHNQPGLEFGEESQLLRSLIMAAYRKKGITHDIQTHDNESPTLMDVFELAEHAHENPKKWTKGPENPEEIKNQAAKIGQILRGFTPDGRYGNLAKQPDEDIFGDNDVIYLDLSQEEASGSSGTGVMGQLMFSMAYELCKQHPGPALYIIDEARFLFREADTLDYLAQRVRHSRHYNTSIRFITQEMDDFFEFEQAEGIVNNSSFKVIHQSADVDDWGDRFDLNRQHKKFVKNAATGSEVPYSQALVQFPEKDQWYPLTIELGEDMLAVADFDELEDSYEDLPGRGKDAREISRVQTELIARIRNGTKDHEAELNNILEDWEKPVWEMLTEERAENCLRRIEQGAHPRKALYVEALEQVRWLIDATGGDDVSNKVVDRLTGAIEQQYSETYSAPEYDEIQRRISNGKLPVEEQKGAGGDTLNEPNNDDDEDDELDDQELGPSQPLQGGDD